MKSAWRHALTSRLNTSDAAALSNLPRHTREYLAQVRVQVANEEEPVYVFDPPAIRIDRGLK